MTATPRAMSPDALLLVAPGCPHCARVLDSLGTLVKAATIGRLEVVNLAVHPEVAAARGVRTAPWLRLGPFELEGLHSIDELRHWAGQANAPQAMARHFRELLATGGRSRVASRVRREPETLETFVELLGDLDTPIDARLGIMATLEELEDSAVARVLVPGLGELSRRGEARVRTDACHALALTGSRDALPFLRACLDDPDEDVRETALEGVEALTMDPDQN